jgi:hypothetical protein
MATIHRKIELYTIGHFLGPQRQNFVLLMTRFHGLFLGLRRRTLHSFQNSVVATAATNLWIHPCKDFRVGRLRFLIKEGDCGEDHARGAKTTLHCAFLLERQLDRMQLATSAESLDSRDGFIGSILNGEDAGMVSLASNQHSAGSTLAFTTAKLRACEFQVLA